MCAFDVLSLVMDILVITRGFRFGGRLLRIMLLREDLHLFLHVVEVCCFVKGVLNRVRFFEGYPLSELKPEP